MSVNNEQTSHHRNADHGIVRRIKTRDSIRSVWMAWALLPFVVPVAVNAAPIGPIVVDNCMQDIYLRYGGQGSGLNCTSNDVQIANVIDVVIHDPCAFPGDTATIDATFEILTNAARHDIGLYFALDGGDALTGTCLISILPWEPANENCTGAGTPYACCTGAGAGTCPFIDLDQMTGTIMGCQNDNTLPCANDAQCDSVGGPCVNLGPGIQDTCGDITTGPRNPIFHTVTNMTFLCTDTTGDGLLDVAACVSWRQPGNNELCLSPLYAFPGSPSKCECDTALSLKVPVPPDPCDPEPDCSHLDTECATFFCDVKGEEGNCDGVDYDPLSTTCEADGDLCTIDHCDGEGNCVTFDNVDCSHLDDQCNDGVCNPATGACESVPKPLSTSCEADGNFCTNDHCDGNGACVTFDTVDCSHLDDQCNDGVCNTGTGACDSAPKAISTPCEADGNQCTIDHCDGAGTCVTFDNVNCSRIDQCTDAVCNPSTGACDPVSDPLSTPCDADGDMCTIDHCDGTGNCVNIDNVDCSHLDTQCQDGACNSATGACQAVPKSLSTPCEADGNLCTIDHCDGNGSCVTFDVVNCPGSTGQCDAGENCNPANGQCESMTQPPLGAPCSEDGDACTLEHCDGAGNCVVFDVVNCSHLDDQCNDGVCDSGTGGCSAVPKPSSTFCDDGDPCTANECDGNGNCVTVSTTDCSHLDDQCNDGVCNPTTGVCETAPKSISTPCEADGNLCTIDHCDGNGTCVTFDNVSCSRIDQCTDSVCNPSTGACDPTPDPLSTSCEADGDLCTIDHCDGSGTCVTFDNVVCPRIDQCNDATCNPSTGGCDPAPDPLSTPCEADGNLCTIDHCDGSGACVTFDNVDCSHLDDDCNEGECDPGTGSCNQVPKPDSTPCTDDGFSCTNDVCINGVCTHVANHAPCDGAFCMDNLCDPAHPDADPTTGCVSIPNHANCDDGVDCTNPDLCDPTNPNADASGCVITPVDEKCDDDNPCSDDSCDHEGVGGCANICRTPGITCPDDLVFECDDVGDFGDPIVDDDCSVAPLVECTEEVEPGKLDQESTITRTCTVTNDCGNQASCQHTIEIVDTTPPDIQCPPDMVFECDAIGEFGEPVVTDNCDPDPDVTVEVEVIVGDCRQAIVAGGVTPPPKTTTVRTFTASDGTATVVATGDGPNVVQCVQIIEIIDTTPPVIVDCPQSVVTCIGEVPAFDPPSCTDTCGDCTVDCSRSDGMPLNSPVEALPLTITCVATDECDNVSDSCEVEVVLGVCAIPTMSEWGLVCMTLLLLALAKVYFGTAPRRRQA